MSKLYGSLENIIIHKFLPHVSNKKKTITHIQLPEFEIVVCKIIDSLCLCAQTMYKDIDCDLVEECGNINEALVNPKYEILTVLKRTMDYLCSLA